VLNYNKKRRKERKYDNKITSRAGRTNRENTEGQKKDEL